jgi:hypothetical protein
MVLDLIWMKLLLWIVFSFRCVRRFTGGGITAFSARSLLLITCHTVGSGILASPHAEHPSTATPPHSEPSFLVEVCGLMG